MRKDRALHIATVELREDLAEEHAESLRANGRRVAVVQRSVSALKVTASVWVVVVELPVVKP